MCNLRFLFSVHFPVKLLLRILTVYKKIARTEWPIKMKIGQPLQKLIGRYKFECLGARTGHPKVKHRVAIC